MLYIFTGNSLTKFSVCDTHNAAAATVRYHNFHNLSDMHVPDFQVSSSSPSLQLNFVVCGMRDGMIKTSEFLIR